jgi:hypothetical protein
MQSRTSYIRWPADIASSSLNISWNVADFVNVLMFRRKKVDRQKYVAYLNVS